MNPDNQRQRILFLTATRADFGKIKSLLTVLENRESEFDVSIAVTGMHLSEKHGNTFREIEKSFPKYKQYIFANHGDDSGMEIALANTILGVSSVLKKVQPDLFVLHGDRIEALAGAIAGALNNIRVAHIEGGEVSGTIDELMRHATSKMAHVHFVANQAAQSLLIQMGESSDSIFVIGSPDLDLMSDEHIRPLSEATERYSIPFSKFALVLLHPVTTNLDETRANAEHVTDFVMESQNTNFIVIGPNNDFGSDIIWDALSKMADLKNVRVFPSLRFEFFVSLLKNAQYILGNSSAGVREAPYLGTPCINVGTRQNSRAEGNLIIDVPTPSSSAIFAAAEKASTIPRKREIKFGDGKSDLRFLEMLTSRKYMTLPLQKQFQSQGKG